MKNPPEPKKSGSKAITINILLIGAVLFLIVFPLFRFKNLPFNGADQEAQATIGKVNGNYKPWFAPIWNPPSHEVETFLFALQAALGAGVMGYCLGYMKGKRERKH